MTTTVAGHEAPNADPALVELATELATEAGVLTLDWFQQPGLEVQNKADGSPVTAADKAAETYIRDRILAAFPADSIIGEEHGNVEGTSGRSWIIDPIDGTRSFTCGVPLYATLIGVMDEHGPLVGVCNIPALGEIVAAGRGLGATYNGQPTSVSSRSDLAAGAVTCSGIDYLPREAVSGILDARATFRTWGDGYGYVLVATGRVEAMVDAPGLSLWDVAPMNVIIPEAGGRITSWSGAPLPAGGSTLASNGLVHDDLLDYLPDL